MSALLIEATEEDRPDHDSGVEVVHQLTFGGLRDSRFRWYHPMIFTLERK